MENTNLFIELVADCLDDVTVKEITLETNLNEIEQFDSLSTMSMSAAINIKYGVNLSGLDINECKTIGEIYALIQGKASK